MNEHLEDLLLAWDDDDLSPGQWDELTALLEQDPQSRRLAVRHFSLTAAIDEQMREAQHEDRIARELQRMAAVDAPIPAPSKRRPLLYAGAAALLVAVLAGYYFQLPLFLIDAMHGQAGRLPQVAEVFGEVELLYAEGDVRIAFDQTLAVGQQVRTSPHSYVTLKYADGTTIQLRGDSQLMIEPSNGGKHLSLLQGGLFAEVARQRHGSPLVINPGRLDQVEVVGTRFQFERIEQGSIVRVEHGQVKFGADHQAVAVGEQQQSTALANMSPRPPEPAQGPIWRGWDHGLRGEYFYQPHFRGDSFTRIDPQIDFHWGKQQPDPSILGPFAVRWTGEVEAPHSGEFVFSTVAHYGVRLWIDGRNVINSGASMGSLEDGPPISLEKGKRYPIKIEYWDQHGDARMRLLWSSQALRKSVVDQQWLHPTMENE
ncbi:PA14 domain-containing protein [Lignipirellula cremea]|uniref:Protective antigen n=1 Tax=Lignipirellula cremea TaxID=2528010 RepID=A0A518DKW5_9BACT|nr:PA14 domain-containing protein [Lignipirellula cremea]QDU92479.1 Protective antigen precursor [Lignipirellula cremea]